MNSEAVMTTMNVDAVTQGARGRVEPAGQPLGRIRDRFRRSGIGEFRPTDWDGVLEMYWEFEGTQRVRGMPPATEEAQAAWVDALWRRGPNVVARSRGRIIGHAALAPDSGAAHDLIVFVRPEWQGRGVGRALVDALVGLARRQGVALIRAGVESRNDSVVTMLRAAGFERQPANGAGEELWTLVPSEPGEARAPRSVAGAAWALLRGWLHAPSASTATGRQAEPIRAFRATSATRSAAPQGGDEARTALSYLSVFHPPGVIRVTTAEEEAALRRGAPAAPARDRNPAQDRNPAPRARSVA